MKPYSVQSLFFILFLLFVPFQLNARANLDIKTLSKSIVKIDVIYREPSYEQPWTYSIQLPASGSGVIIKGNKILTSAHVISNSTSIIIKKMNDSVEIELSQGSFNMTVILDTNACKESEKEILNRYSIKSSKSKNLQ